MLAFQISVNQQRLCTVSSAQAVSVIAMLKGEQTIGGAEPPTLSVSGVMSADTYATWANQTLMVGDCITVEVVDVAASDLSAPTSIKEEILAMVESERRAHYERLKAEYEPSPT